jgi:hypothetical protein
MSGRARSAENSVIVLPEPGGPQSTENKNWRIEIFSLFSGYSGSLISL